MQINKAANFFFAVIKDILARVRIEGRKFDMRLGVMTRYICEGTKYLLMSIHILNDYNCKILKPEL